MTGSFVQNSDYMSVHSFRLESEQRGVSATPTQMIGCPAVITNQAPEGFSAILDPPIYLKAQSELASDK